MELIRVFYTRRNPAALSKILDSSVPLWIILLVLFDQNDVSLSLFYLFCYLQESPENELMKRKRQFAAN